MCEIAVLDPRRFALSDLVEAALELYRSQRSALGLVAVYDERGKFRYETYRDVTPSQPDLWSFFGDHLRCYRIILHGRLATHGEKDNTGTHPIPVDCPKCDVDWVLHNGVINFTQQTIETHEEAGHEYTTEVDSEIIAHRYAEVPKEFDTPKQVHATDQQINRQPAYILLNEDRMFFRAKPSSYSKYVISGNTEMWRRQAWWRDEGYDGTEYNEMIRTPQTEAQPDWTDRTEAATAEVEA